jgi:cell volume regulation protein A
MDAQPWVLAAGLLLIAGVLASKTSARFGVPGLLLFLAVGMLAGSDGIGGLEFDDFELSRSFGIVALAFILFSGGLGTRYQTIRPVLRQGLALATVGVILTAGLLGWAASAILGLPLEEGLLLGAIIASTDAAAVFSILRSRGLPIKERVASTLELESGSNDPAAVFLTVAVISYITEDATNLWAVVGSFALQMGVGAAAGYALARLAVVGINRLNLDQEGLYPVFTFAFVLLTLEGVTYLGGSGFLAVYVAGVTMAHHDHLHRRSLARFHDALAWLVQIAMFVLLGLLVFPSRLDDVAAEAFLIAILLMFVARPVAVMLTLLPMRAGVRESAFVSWVGLRGATPIILATFPVAAAVPDADILFDVVFFVVITSVIAQGTTLPWAARRLGLVDDAAVTERRITFDSVITGDEGPQLREIVVPAEAAAVGQQIVDLSVPPGVLIVLVRRGAVSFMPQGRTVIRAGDGLLVAAEPSQRHAVDALFVEHRPVAEAPDDEHHDGHETPGREPG